MASPSSLPQSADYIIIGGGTAGLVVANRLSKDPNVQVLVLESGPDRTADPRIQDANAWPTLRGSELDWQMKTVPQTGLNNRELEQVAGKVLGGSSAINGLIWMPPSRAGLDAWSALGNPRWNWPTIMPYCHASHTVTAPGKSSEQAGPIQITYPALSDESNVPLLDAWNQALGRQGYEFTSDIMGGQKAIGVRPFAATLDPESGCRSSADGTHARAQRSNLHIVTDATVRRIVFSSQAENDHRTGNPRAVAIAAEIDWNGQTVKVTAEKEVILAAGALQTPKILELSGVGQKDRLTKLGIPVVVDRPGVGENFQNHVMSMFSTPLKIKGISPGFKATALTRLDQADLEKIFSTSKDNVREYHGTIMSILNNPDEASAQYIINALPGAVVIGAILSLPHSRGSVHISSPDVNAKPIIDPQFFSNDIDIEILSRHIQNLHRLTNDPAFEGILEPTEVPQNLETLKQQLRDATALAANHACGTASMLPREAGGVVNENLRVYGTKNVRVVDASIIPLIPHANPMSTVYAVAEKAVDMMRDDDVSDD